MGHGLWAVVLNTNQQTLEHALWTLDSVGEAVFCNWFSTVTYRADTMEFHASISTKRQKSILPLSAMQPWAPMVPTCTLSSDQNRKNDSRTNKLHQKYQGLNERDLIIWTWFAVRRHFTSGFLADKLMRFQADHPWCTQQLSGCRSSVWLFYSRLPLFNHLLLSSWTFLSEVKKTLETEQWSISPG